MGPELHFAENMHFVCHIGQVKQLSYRVEIVNFPPCQSVLRVFLVFKRTVLFKGAI